MRERLSMDSRSFSANQINGFPGILYIVFSQNFDCVLLTITLLLTITWMPSTKSDINFDGAGSLCTTLRLIHGLNLIHATKSVSHENPCLNSYIASSKPCIVHVCNMIVVCLMQETFRGSAKSSAKISPSVTPHHRKMAPLLWCLPPWPATWPWLSC